MEDITAVRLEAKANHAAILRSFCQHEGFKIWKKELDDRINDLKNEWINADDDKAKQLRLRAKVYTEMIDIIKQKILEGDNANRQLRAESENQDPDAA